MVHATSVHEAVDKCHNCSLRGTNRLSAHACKYSQAMAARLAAKPPETRGEGVAEKASEQESAACSLGGSCCEGLHCIICRPGMLHCSKP